MYKTVPLLQIPEGEVMCACLVITSSKPAVSTFPMNSYLLCSSKFSLYTVCFSWSEGERGCQTDTIQIDRPDLQAQMSDLLFHN